MINFESVVGHWPSASSDMELYAIEILPAFFCDASKILMFLAPGEPSHSIVHRAFGGIQYRF